MKIKSVPFFRMRFTKSEIEAVARTIKSGWLTTGAITRELEGRFCRFAGARYGVAVNSCTSGLHLALKALELGRGAEVITTPYTFVASTEAIIHAGARPIYADINPQTLNIDPEAVAEKVSSRARAILPVHIAGLPCRLDSLAKIARRHDLYIVNDSAHAIGACFKGRPIGAYGDLSVFSFYATKNLTTGEGGMITVNRKSLAEKMQILCMHGMDRRAWRRYIDQGCWYYEVVALGFKYNLADLNAALGLAMLDRLGKLQAARERISAWYDTALGKYDELELPVRDPDSLSAWHLYIIRLRTERLRINRDQFIAELTARQVGTSVHFIPLFLQPWYKGKFGLYKKNFPGAWEAYQRVITLPFYPELRPEEVAYVADSIGKILAKFHK